MKYHALFVIFEKAAKFENVVCYILGGALRANILFLCRNSVLLFVLIYKVTYPFVSFAKSAPYCHVVLRNLYTEGHIGQMVVSQNMQITKCCLVIQCKALQ